MQQARINYPVSDHTGQVVVAAGEVGTVVKVIRDPEDDSVPVELEVQFAQTSVRLPADEFEAVQS